MSTSRKHSTRRVALAISLLSSACVGRPATNEEASDTPVEDPVISTCRDWCEVALPCSQVYAQQWAFSTRDECEEQCFGYFDALSGISDGACDEPLLTLNQCAAELTCEQFGEFEKEYWDTEFVDNPPCQVELMAFLSVGLCT